MTDPRGMRTEDEQDARDSAKQPGEEAFGMQGRINTSWQSVRRHTRMFVADLELFLSLQLARLIVYRNTRRVQDQKRRGTSPAGK
jgi:hypothetical protein